MSVVAWRVVAQRYAVTPYNPFDGEGARLNGGRWNGVGTAVVYASASRSLAILEVLVHVVYKSALLGYCMFSVTFDESEVASLDPSELPPDWADPMAPAALRVIGDAWVRAAKSPVLRVPSAVVEGEYNYVLNPRHPGFGKLVLGDQQSLPIDKRLLVG